MTHGVSPSSVRRSAMMRAARRISSGRSTLGSRSKTILSGRCGRPGRAPALLSTATGAVASAGPFELGLARRVVRHRVEQVERAAVVVVAPEDAQPGPPRAGAELPGAIGIAGSFAGALPGGGAAGGEFAARGEFAVLGDCRGQLGRGALRIQQAGLEVRAQDEQLAPGGAACDALAGAAERERVPR